jgi:hypothetical protein
MSTARIANLPSVQHLPKLQSLRLVVDPLSRIGVATRVFEYGPFHGIVAAAEFRNDDFSETPFGTAPFPSMTVNVPGSRRSVVEVNQHPTMPSLQLTPRQAADVIAYFMSLRR